VIVIAVALAAAAAWCWVHPPLDPRLVRILGGRPPRATDRSVTRWPVLAGACLALGLLLLVGGVPGVALAVASVVVVPRLLGRLESRGARARRESLERQAPLLADLLAATLHAGATVRDALAVSGDAVGSPTADVVRPVVASIDLGADPATAWLTVGVAPAHRPLVDALVRASDSGAPIAELLARAAEDLRRDRRRDVEVAARSAGVRAVAPLAACFLPAFLLLGVVPVIASLAGGLIGF